MLWHRHRAGFTFVELLVVSAIMGILVALLLPAVQQAREAAHRTSCKNNLRQINLALQHYHDQYAMLPAGTVNSTGPIRNAESGFHHSWYVALLPYLEEAPADRQIDRQRDIYDPIHKSIRQHRIPLLLCPSDDSLDESEEPVDLALCNYAGNHHPWEAPINNDNLGVLYLNSYLPLTQIPDGTSYTIAVGEILRAVDDLGWASGTRATLRNTWLSPNLTPGGEAYYERGEFRQQALADQGFAGWSIDGPASSQAVESSSETSDADEGGGESTEDWETMSGMVSAEPMQESGLPPAIKKMLEGDPHLIVGGFSSPHAGGIHVGMADSSVRFISQNIGAREWHNLGNRADGDLHDDW